MRAPSLPPFRNHSSHAVDNEKKKSPFDFLRLSPPLSLPPSHPHLARHDIPSRCRPRGLLVGPLCARLRQYRSLCPLVVLPSFKVRSLSPLLSLFSSFGSDLLSCALFAVSLRASPLQALSSTRPPPTTSSETHCSASWRLFSSSIRKGCVRRSALFSFFSLPCVPSTR